MTRRNALILAAQVAVLCVAIAVSVMTSTAADWYPIELVVLLLVLAVGSDLLTVEVRGIRVSGAFLAIVLAMALLGPAPAVAMGILSSVDRRDRVAAALAARPSTTSRSGHSSRRSAP